MYDNLVKRLRNIACLAEKGLVIPPHICLEAADALEKLSISLIEIISITFPEIILDVVGKDGEDFNDAIEELLKKKDCSYWFEDGGFCSFFALNALEQENKERKTE